MSEIEKVENLEEVASNQIVEKPVENSADLSEKSAPEGYEKDNNVYVLQLKIDGTYERMKVVNNKIEAPNTGAESANFLPILAGVASILLGGTAFFAKKRF